jgi:hypothetical protein
VKHWLIALFTLLVSCFVCVPAHAQAPSAPQDELTCPIGTIPVNPQGYFSNLNRFTGKVRQHACVDFNGNLTLQPETVTVNVSTSVPVTCASSMTFPMAVTFATDFFVNLNCSVTSSAMSGTLTTGQEAVFTLTQDATGNRTFTWPVNFLNTPTLNIAANGTTVVTFQYCGATGNGNACPAGNWQNTDVGPAGAISFPVTGPGVFTNSPTGDNGTFVFLLDGLNPSTEWTGIGQPGANTSALIGGVLTPSGSVAHQSTAVAGYNNCQSGSTFCVGGYFSTRAQANGAGGVWGDNPIASDGGFNNVLMRGMEVDTNISGSSPSTDIRGIQINGIHATPAGGTAMNLPSRIAVSIDGGRWNEGYACGAGTMVVTAGLSGGGACFFMGGSFGSAGVQNSHYFAAMGQTAGNAHPYMYMFENGATGYFEMANSPFAPDQGLIATGTAAGLVGTGACATITTQTGGAWGGTFKCTGTTGAATVTVTIGGGVTAPNGWTLTSAWDQTTVANSLHQNAGGTTTTLIIGAATVTSGDVISWSAVGF